MFFGVFLIAEKCINARIMDGLQHDTMDTIFLKQVFHLKVENLPIINPVVDSQVFTVQVKKHLSLGEVQARQMWSVYCSWQFLKATILWELSLPQCQVSTAWYCCWSPLCCSPGSAVQVTLRPLSFVINQSKAQFEYLTDIYPTPHMLMQSSKEWVRSPKKPKRLPSFIKHLAMSEPCLIFHEQTSFY